MNKKGGVPSTLVTVWSLIIWTLLIIAFIILFQLTAKVSNMEPGDVERNATLTGNLNSKIELRNIMLSYLNTPIKTCSFAQEKNMTYDLTYAEMIRLFMRGEPIKEINTDVRFRYLETDTGPIEEDETLGGEYGVDIQDNDGWKNNSYIKYMYVWDVCTDIYFNGVSKNISDLNKMRKKGRLNYLYQLGNYEKELIFSKEAFNKYNDFREDTPSIEIQTAEGKVYFTLNKEFG